MNRARASRRLATLSAALGLGFIRISTSMAQVCGDADGNGLVSVTDGVLTLRTAAGLSSECTIQACDVDDNGAVTITDGVNVLRIAAGLAAIADCGIAAPTPTPTPGADPAIGCYVLDRRGCFEVRFEDQDTPDPSRKVVAFAADCASTTPADTCATGCFRTDTFLVTDGRFSHRHGEIGGTDCPTDGYAITGSFVSTTRAEGTIEYSRDCAVVAELTFAAAIPSTPQPTPAAPAPGPRVTIGGGGSVSCLAPPP